MQIGTTQIFGGNKEYMRFAWSITVHERVAYVLCGYLGSRVFIWWSFHVLVFGTVPIWSWRCQETTWCRRCGGTMIQGNQPPMGECFQRFGISLPCFDSHFPGCQGSQKWLSHQPWACFLGLLSPSRVWNSGRGNALLILASCPMDFRRSSGILRMALWRWVLPRRLTVQLSVTWKAFSSFSGSLHRRQVLVGEFDHW